MMFHSKSHSIYRSRSHSSSRSSNGFTLIELLIVLVLIGLSSAFVMPSMWQQLEQTQYRAEVAKLKALANYCRHYSFYQGKILEVKLSANFFTVSTLNDGKLLRKLEFETFSFAQQTIHFDRQSTFHRNTLSIIRNNRDNPVELTL